MQTIVLAVQNSVTRRDGHRHQYDGTNSLTPAVVAALPEPLHTGVVDAYANALAPTFWYLVPLLAFGFVLTLFLREVKLSDVAGMVARAEASADHGALIKGNLPQPVKAGQESATGAHPRAPDASRTPGRRPRHRPRAGSPQWTQLRTVAAPRRSLWFGTHGGAIAGFLRTEASTGALGPSRTNGRGSDVDYEAPQRPPRS